MNRILLIIYACSLMTLGTNAQNMLLSNNNPLVSAVDRRVDSVMRLSMANTNRVGVSIGLIENGNTHYYSYGETIKGSGTVANPFTIYELGSVTKTFTAWLLSMTIEDKLVQPGDDIRKYLPGEYPALQFNGKPITLLNLANHTAGFPRIPDDLDQQPGYDSLDPYKNYSKEMMLNFLKKVQLKEEPGLHSEYSNYGMALLGLILERVYKKPYPELLKKKILKPLKMRHTFVAIPEAEMPLMAKVYSDQGDARPLWNMNDMAAAGGLRSNVNDMLLYMQANYREKGAPLKRVHQPTVSINKSLSVAMGWQVSKMPNGNTLIWHNGGTYGSSSFCFYMKETGLTLVLLSNSGIIADGMAIALLKAFMN